ncbi:hypothetical protein EVAR_97432_1 [Eumeta japonica]|uniref:Uncharacterized protein n=1 Tax=Eumeta variegata TaxID=151549 RepID=A0A4C1WXB6_EUMVA|nr:hypothetical protein EVAR_97432_1 [Eumeta japonica]
MRAALIRSASTSVRPPAVGCVSSLSCASLPFPRRAPTYAGAPFHRRRLRNDRARPRVGRRLGSGTVSINGSTRYGPLPLEPSESCPRQEDARA